MKGFLIFITLIVAGSVYFFTHTADFAAEAVKQLELEEKPDDPSFREGLYRDPAAFAASHKPYLDKRAQLGKWMSIFGEKAMMQVLATRTRNLYAESNLATDPSYGDLLWRSATELEDQNNLFMAQEALDLARLYLKDFPDGVHKDEMSATATRIQYKYNFK